MPVNCITFNVNGNFCFTHFSLKQGGMWAFDHLCENIEMVSLTVGKITFSHRNFVTKIFGYKFATILPPKNGDKFARHKKVIDWYQQEKLSPFCYQKLITNYFPSNCQLNFCIKIISHQKFGCAFFKFSLNCHRIFGAKIIVPPKFLCHKIQPPKFSHKKFLLCIFKKISRFLL